MQGIVSIYPALASNTIHLFPGSKGVFGSLTIGGSDLTRYTPTDTSFNLAPDVERDLVVDIQTIPIEFLNHSVETLLPSPTLAFIDSTVPQIWLPTAACERFEQTLGLVWDESAKLYIVDRALHQTLLQSQPTFTFSLGNDERSEPTVEIVLPYASFDLIAKPPMIKNVTEDLFYFPLKRGNDTQITLGRTFLQEA